MPHMLVRGHMRFDEEEHDRKAELETRISVLECELAELREELAIARKVEAELERTNSKLENKLLLVGNRRARRDSMVNAAEVFEEDLRHYCEIDTLPQAPEGWGERSSRRIRDLLVQFSGWAGTRHQDLAAHDESVTRRAIRGALMDMVYVAQKDLGFANIDLESILRK